MEVRAGYKLTEVGVIPEGWSLSRLGELCGFENGDRGSNYPSPNSFASSGVPFVNAGHLSEGKIISGGMNYITTEAYNRLGGGKLKPGDILFCLRGSLGKFGIVSDEFGGGAIASSLVIVRPRSGVIRGDFLICYFGSALCAQMIETWSGGAAQPNLGAQDLARFSIPLPPTEAEQRAIATALSDMDALLDGLDRLIAKKRDLKQAAMQQLLTGQTRLPGFCGEWEVKRLGEVAEIKDGTHQTPKYVQSGVPFYSVEHVTSGDFTDTKFISEGEHRILSRSAKIEKGDILMTRIGSIGDCKLIDWAVNASFYVSLALLKIRLGYSAAFISHYSNTAAFKKEIELHSLQSAIPRKINLGPISKVNIGVPPTLCEQAAIAAVLSDMDAELAALEARRDKTRDLKQGMMQELLTGRTRLV